MAALELAPDYEILPCAMSTDVFAALLDGRARCAVLPIENTLHGSVTEHYDLLLTNPVRIDAEGLLQIRHNLIAAPSVELSAIRTVLSAPSRSISAASSSRASRSSAPSMTRGRWPSDIMEVAAKGHRRSGAGARRQRIRCQRPPARRRRPRAECHPLSSHPPSPGSSTHCRA